MVTKIGKFIQIIFCLTFFLALPIYANLKIELGITDLKGNALVKTSLDKPVLLTIKITGTAQSLPISIEGIEHFNYEPRGSFKTHYSINGVSTQTTEHRYVLRPTKKGLFKIGPVLCTYENTTIRSNAINLEVLAQSDNSDASKSTDQSSVFVEFFPQKTNGFVGEKIPITIRFNSCKNVELIDCLFPKLDEKIIFFTPLQKITENEKIMGNKKYHSIEWHSELEINKAGRWTIPELTIVYNVLKNRSGFSDSFFDQFLGFKTRNQKKAYGKEFVININPLPPSDKKPDGVGRFESFSASLDKNTITQGSGCVLSLTLKGSHNLDSIKQPRLILPEELKYYESACHTNTNTGEKVFEYIIQGLSPGAWVIPAQEFFFFDTDQASYNTLKTQELYLTIQNDHSINQYQNSNQSLQDVSSQPEEKTITPMNDIKALNERSPWYPLKQRSLSFPLFIILSIIPLLYLLSLLLSTMMKRFKNDTRSLSKNAFIIAHKKLNTAKKINQPDQLHDIFVDLFAQRCAIAPAFINQETIETQLQKAHSTPEFLKQWTRFFSELCEIAYAQQQPIDTQALFDRAYVWLNQLEEVL